MKSHLNNILSPFLITCFVALAGWSSLPTLLGQGQGSLTFLNAVPLETPTIFLVNGKSLKPEGFKSGFCTSALLFNASSQVVVARNGALESSPVTVTPSASASPLVIASMVLKEDPTTKEIKPKLIVIPATNLPKGRGWNYQVFYSSLKPATDFKINGEGVSIKGGQGKNFLGVGGSFKIEMGDKTIANFSPENHGNFFVILYDKTDGTVGSNIAQDEVYFAGPK